jgi:hypothetical protein
MVFNAVSGSNFGSSTILLPSITDRINTVVRP